MKVDWNKAPDIKKKVVHLVSETNLDSIKSSSIYCYRSKNAKTRAYARIWGLSRIWQLALGQKPSYIIEVISERFDRLSSDQKDKVLLHELAHIPKNFSGSLVPHIRHGKRKFKDKVKSYENNYFTRRRFQ